MRKYFFMGLGCATGFAVIFIVLFFISYCSTQRSIDKFYSDYEKKAPKTQYFDVTTKKGTFTLHTKMPKDSVKLLIGKPNETDVMDLGGTIREEYEYSKDSYHSLKIVFMDGLLESVSNY
jgi:hypothetical protein